MAKFRMVPDDLEEAEFISMLISEWITKNEAELLKDRPRHRVMLNREANWQGIVIDLKEDAKSEPTSDKATPAARSEKGAQKAAPAEQKATAK